MIFDLRCPECNGAFIKHSGWNDETKMKFFCCECLNSFVEEDEDYDREM